MVGEVKTSLESLSSRVMAADDRISELKMRCITTPYNRRDWKRALKQTNSQWKKILKECEQIKIEVFNKLNRNT